MKGLIRFCALKLALRMFAEVSLERSEEVQVAGAGLVVLGLPSWLCGLLLSSGRASSPPWNTWRGTSMVHLQKVWLIAELAS